MTLLHLLHLLGILLCISARIYPIASTEYTAGKIAVVTWIDDGHHPTLHQMGLVHIHLLFANGVRVSLIRMGRIGG